MEEGITLPVRTVFNLALDEGVGPIENHGPPGCFDVQLFDAKHEGNMQQMEG